MVKTPHLKPFSCVCGVDTFSPVLSTLTLYGWSSTCGEERRCRKQAATADQVTDGWKRACWREEVTAKAGRARSWRADRVSQN